MQQWIELNKCRPKDTVRSLSTGSLLYTWRR